MLVNTLICAFFLADSYLYLFGQRKIYDYRGDRVVRQIGLGFHMILNGFLKVERFWSVRTVHVHYLTHLTAMMLHYCILELGTHICFM